MARQMPVRAPHWTPMQARRLAGGGAARAPEAGATLGGGGRAVTHVETRALASRFRAGPRGRGVANDSTPRVDWEPGAPPLKECSRRVLMEQTLLLNATYEPL